MVLQTPYKPSLVRADWSGASHMICYGACRGCAAAATYGFEIAGLSANVQFVKTANDGPTDPRLLGGSTVTRLYLRKTSSGPAQVRLREVTADGARTGGLVSFQF
jgi:hypothetical protein